MDEQSLDTNSIYIAIEYYKVLFWGIVLTRRYTTREATCANVHGNPPPYCGCGS